jgi:chromosomal replication initiation ATPase DnaA
VTDTATFADSTPLIGPYSAPKAADHSRHPLDLARAVAREWGYSLADLQGWGRTKRVSLARKSLVRALYGECAMSTTEIGALLGGRDHTTILYLLGTLGRQA